MRVRHWKLRGSFTVEAAFVVPVILGIVFMLWYCLFIFHDKVVVTGNAGEVVWQYWSQGEVQSEKEIEEALGKHVWLMYPERWECHRKGGYYRCAGDGVSNWKIPVMNAFFQAEQTASWEQSVYEMAPEKVVRYRKRKGSDDGDKAGQPVKEEIQKVQ